MGVVGPADGSAIEGSRKGPGSSAGIVTAADVLGGGRLKLAQFAVPGLKEARWVMVVPKVGHTPDRYPRSAGAMRRRPLGLDVA